MQLNLSKCFHVEKVTIKFELCLNSLGNRIDYTLWTFTEWSLSLIKMTLKLERLIRDCYSKFLVIISISDRVERIESTKMKEIVITSFFILYGTQFFQLSEESFFRYMIWGKVAQTIIFRRL